MSFISFEFIILFVCCFLLYCLAGNKGRKYILLVASSVFIGYYHPMFLVTALLVSLLAYYAGQCIEKVRPSGHARVAYVATVLLLVGGWIIFRYADKLSGNGGWLFPLGISFYTFQAISYLTEIYWEEEKPEKNLTDFLLYMLFFMKFLAGPIERSAGFLSQIRNLQQPSYPMMVYGLRLIVVGLMKKLVIADQLSPYINGVFDSSHTASGIQLLMACLLYPVELYADFSGYTDMAIGGAMMFGIALSPNFNRPFVAQSTTDFWRRWHMSLSFWVRDYLYMPLASATRRWGQWGVTFSLLVTFVALGAWHGAGWTFVVYGLIQGIVIVYELKTQTWRNAVRKSRWSGLYSAFSVVRTYLAFALSLVFFRSSSVSEACSFISRMSFQHNVSWKEMNIGMSDHICIVTGAGLVLVFLYEYFMARADLLERLSRVPLPLRWAIYYLAIFAILAYGKFGMEEFIYLQF